MKALLFAQYKETGKLLALFFAGLFYFGIHWRQVRGRLHREWIQYSFFSLVIALFPITAMALLRYQTSRLTYPWIFSIVPITGFLAFFGVELLWEQVLPASSAFGRYAILKNRSSRYLAGLFGAVLLCFLLGNLGQLQKVSAKEKQALSDAGALLELLEETDGERGWKLWGPRELLEQTRRLSGRVELLYGRDIWEAEAAAYDLESYGEAVTADYIWMERVYDPYEAADSGEKEIADALSRGVNVILFPKEAPGAGMWIPGEKELRACLPGNLAMTQQILGDYLVFLLTEG